MRSLGFCLLLGLAGCTVHATEPVAYVETTAAPAYVYGYPSTYYEGRTVYFVDGRWVYPDRGRWLYYQTEPAPLYQYRQRSYVRTAPPAPRVVAPPRGGAPYGGRPPPGSRPPASAPPAVRTR